MSTHGFFQNAMKALIAARTRQAAAYVNGALLMLDDETLRRNGHDRSELLRQPARNSVS